MNEIIFFLKEFWGYSKER